MGVKPVANYLKHENHLIVWPVSQEALESDLFQGNIALNARYDMSNKELLDACVEALQLDKNKSYRIILVRANGEVELSLNQTVAEAGLRNGDPLKITAA
jgi:hypothetical protein